MEFQTFEMVKGRILENRSGYYIKIQNIKERFIKIQQKTQLEKVVFTRPGNNQI